MDIATKYRVSLGERVELSKWSTDDAEGVERAVAEAQAGTHEGTPRVGREYVGIDDFHGMVDLLIGCGMDLPQSPGFVERVEKLWEERKFVIGS